MTSLPARVSLVTLGVADVAAATAFFQRLGWQPSPDSVPGVVSFFATAGAALALFGRDDLAADAQLATGDMPAYRGVALAINLEDTTAVDRFLAVAAEAGATIRKPAQHAEWGGYSGYFTDPDGHLWEVAYNPSWPIGADGRPVLG